MKSLQDIANIIHFEKTWCILIVPMVMMAFDYLTGIMKAWHNHDIQSSKLRDGLNRKFGEVIVIIISLFLQYSIGLPKEITTFVSIYIIVMELISIIENLGAIGVKVPKWIKDRLVSIAEENEDVEEKS
jgi:toxin secretion/phage lysis holin